MVKFFASASLALLACSSPTRVWAGSKITVGSAVASNQQLSIDRIDHSVWNALLLKYCDDRGFVDYRSWQNSPHDLRQLDAYLAHLSQANRLLPAATPARFAFWINAYNAVTIKGILREYPTTSIRNHTAKLVGYNIWDDLLLAVGSKQYSLNQIEHEVLRPMGDPRIHFAIVCASIGCPPLRNTAYTAEQLDAQLADNAQRFFADPTKFAVTREGTLQLSEILNWFAKDFGPNERVQLQTIAPYLPTPTAQALARSGQARVTYLEYDWGLNDQVAARQQLR